MWDNIYDLKIQYFVIKKKFNLSQKLLLAICIDNTYI